MVASLLAGGDCIEDADVLRKGGTEAVLRRDRLGGVLHEYRRAA